MTIPRCLGSLLLVASLSSLPAAAATDVVTVGTVTATGTSVDVPVSIRDVSTTPLGMDQPPGSKIQSYSIKVDYSPASSVSSVTFSRAGITQALTPTSEFTPSSAGSASLLDTFQESTNPIPFTLNAAAPGNRVAHLVFNLSASAAPGSTITLTLDSSLTQLTDEGGTAATKETVANGRLSLVNGSITVPPLSLTITPSPHSVDLHSSTGTMRATISAVTGSTTTVNLSSSNTAVATVPASVSIPSGSTFASFAIQALSIGQTTITGTISPGGATATATLNIVGPSLLLLPPQQTIPLGGSTGFTVSMSTAQASDAVVTLTAGDPTVITIPATVTIPAGQKNATFNVTGVKVGTSSLQARLPSALGGSAGGASVDVSSTCIVPVAPVIAGPAQAASGSPYDITWLAVSGATDYFVDEATVPGFENATTTTVTDVKATFTHVVAADTTYYYRVRARNHAGTCNDTSPSSAAISVVVKPAAAPVIRILPVVGSAAGAFGAFFRTSVQLYNPKTSTVTGKIVFHPQGANGSDADPSLTYALAAGKTMAIDDLLVAMSQSGVGTADLVADLNSPLPVSSVRVFNDAGAAGTTGLSEDAMKPEEALGVGDSGALIAPADFKNFRLNIGVRTLSAGATLVVAVRDKDGITVKLVNKTYGPTFFAQTGASALLDGFTLSGGETLTFTVTAGSAIIYGSTTDNTTNDPTMQIVHKL